MTIPAATIPAATIRPSFYSKGVADVDTGAPYAGLVYAIDHPDIMKANAKWFETQYYFLMERFAEVEIAGNVFSKIAIMRAKAWRFANGHTRPALGGHLLEKLAVSFIGGKISDAHLSALPAELQRRGTFVLHNGDNSMLWIQALLTHFPDLNNQPN